MIKKPPQYLYTLTWFTLGICVGFMSVNEYEVEQDQCQSSDLQQQRQQEMDSYTYEIEHQKALLYSYQKTSHEALQQVEVLQNRVQYLKQEEKRMSR